MLIDDKSGTGYWKQLWRVELVVAICLLLYAAALSALLRVGAAVFSSAPPAFEGNYPIAAGLGLMSAVALVAFIRMGPIALYAIPSTVIVALAVHAVMKRMRW